jgi:hypothetical protein
MGSRLSFYVLEKIKISCSSWDSNLGPPSPYPSRYMCVCTIHRRLEESGFELINVQLGNLAAETEKNLDENSDERVSRRRS